MAYSDEDWIALGVQLDTPGWINGSGTISNEMEGSRVSDFIPVTPGDIYQFALIVPSNKRTWTRCTYYDASQAFLGECWYVSNYTLYAERKVYHRSSGWTVPENAAYARISTLHVSDDGGRIDLLGPAGGGDSMSAPTANGKARNFFLESAGPFGSGINTDRNINYTEFTYLAFKQGWALEEAVPAVLSFDLTMNVNTANPELRIYDTLRRGPMQFKPGGQDIATLKLEGDVGETITGRYSVVGTWEPRENPDPAQTWNWLDLYSIYGTGNTYTLENVMFEIGEVAHPWRPAPEDTEQPSDLVYASEGVDLGDTSGLATDADARGYASDAQAAAISTAAADATNKAGAAQAAAISAAAADATSKANAAQAAAEATASADATSKAGAAEAAAKAHADAQVATRARTFATGWEYRQTADTAVVEGKTYYTRSGTDPDWEWTAVENPVDADIATYWELLPERPVPPYSPGDVWLQGDGGAILACTAAKASGESFSDDDWTLASGYTDDAAAAVLEGGIEALRQADTALSGRIDSAAEASRNAIAALDGRVAAAEGSISGVSGRLVSLEDYVRVVGGDHLELGKAGSSVTASLENDRLAFLLLGQDAPVAYIAADEDGTGKLFVTQAVVVSELQFGHGKWAWTERKNGNMALKWRGGEA